MLVGETDKQDVGGWLKQKQLITKLYERISYPKIGIVISKS